MRVIIEQISGEDLEKIISRTNSPENIYDHYGGLFPKIQILGIRDIRTEGKAKHFYRDVKLAIHESQMSYAEYSEFMEFVYIANGGKR